MVLVSKSDFLTSWLQTACMAKRGKHALFKQAEREIKHLSWVSKNLANSKQLRDCKLAVLEKRTAVCELLSDSYEAIAEHLKKR